MEELVGWVRKEVLVPTPAYSNESKPHSQPTMKTRDDYMNHLAQLAYEYGTQQWIPSTDAGENRSTLHLAGFSRENIYDDTLS